MNSWQANVEHAPPAAQLASLHRFREYAMHCVWGIYITHRERDYAASAAEAAYEQVDHVEGELSRFIETSDIAHINALQAGEHVQVGIEALECLELSQEVFEQTHGAFDVTYASTTESRSDMRFLQVEPRARTVRVSADGVVVDLGGMGKGYAVDQAVAVLRDWSIESALIHAGQSTLYALGRAPDGRDWQIPIRDPHDHTRTLTHVTLRDRALSGSGALVKGRHILDPRSGQPASGPSGAWCIADSAALCDALSTAFMVLTPDESHAYCRKHESVVGLLCDADGAGRDLRRIGEP